MRCILVNRCSMVHFWYVGKLRQLDIVSEFPIYRDITTLKLKERRNQRNIMEKTINLEMFDCPYTSISVTIPIPLYKILFHIQTNREKFDILYIFIITLLFVLFYIIFLMKSVLYIFTIMSKTLLIVNYVKLCLYKFIYILFL